MSRKIQKLISYELLDIELWTHYPEKYPKKSSCPYGGGLIIGKAYTPDRYEQAEIDIRNYFSDLGMEAVIMNPLYQFDDRSETMVTIDIFPKSRRNEKPEAVCVFDVPSWFSEVEALIAKHETRTSEIFRFGGKLKMSNGDGVHFSDDSVLNEIEGSVRAIVSNNKRKEDLIELVVQGNERAVKALQWIEKDKASLCRIMSLLDQSQNKTDVYKNLLLRQLIPLIDMYSESIGCESIVVLESLLCSSGPVVRNKILSILSMFSGEKIRFLSDECIIFIKEISATKQLNCSYPAMEIVRKLKSSEA